jgi:mycothiol maleylpyruvate isomerase-like protein
MYGPAMDSAGYLVHLRRELSSFRACLAADLSAPVEHCGDWTLYDLADHLGQGNLWAATAVTEQRGDYEGPAPNRRVLAAAQVPRNPDPPVGCGACARDRRPA